MSEIKADGQNSPGLGGLEEEGRISGGKSVDDDQVQVSDRAILDLMRGSSAVTVSWLSKQLQVTDTAIRQRLTRLMDRGQVVRSSQREGRGRPKHLYRITDLGIRQCGANLEDLAVALWKEVLGIKDAEVRKTIIDGVVARLAEQYTPEIQGSSPEERSQQVVELFNRRNVSFAFNNNHGDGRFSVLGCPYPGLSEHDQQICSMEHALFQKLIGLPLERVSEGCDGCHCQFVPAQPAEQSSISGPQVTNLGQSIGEPSEGVGGCCSSGNCQTSSSQLPATAGSNPLGSGFVSSVALGTKGQTQPGSQTGSNPSGGCCGGNTGCSGGPGFNK